VAARIPRNFRGHFSLGERRLGGAANQRRRAGTMGETQSVNDIRTAIRELSARADLARKEGRPEDAAEIEQRIDGYREELAHRP
jgi:hypothetical protein